MDGGKSLTPGLVKGDAGGQYISEGLLRGIWGREKDSNRGRDSGGG